MRGRSGLVVGFSLLWIGAYFLLRRPLHLEGGGPILILLALIFFSISAAVDFGGPLFPAGILGGLGAALLLQERLARWIPGWATIVLGIGLGFLLVAAIDKTKERKRRPSPVPPGVALVAVAGGAWLSRNLALRWTWETELVHLWPWLAVAVGLLLVLIAILER